jgi:hypothetical protein
MTSEMPVFSRSRSLTTTRPRVLGVCWVVYGVLRLAMTLWLISFTTTATLMFGALLTRVPDPFTLMSAFHFSLSRRDDVVRRVRRCRNSGWSYPSRRPAFRARPCDCRGATFALGVALRDCVGHLYVGRVAARNASTALRHLRDRSAEIGVNAVHLEK